MGDHYRPGGRDFNNRPPYEEDRDSRRYYDDYNSYDRPMQPTAHHMYDDYDRPPPPPDRGYHFRGAAGNASHNEVYQFRGVDHRRQGMDHRRDNDHPARPYRDEYYPSQQPSHGFDFRPQNAPQGPRFHDTRPDDRERRLDHNRNRRGGKDFSRGRGDGRRNRGPYVKPGASERAILNTNRSPTPEQLEGMNVGGSRFNFENLISLEENDNDSASMDTSDSNEEQQRNRDIEGTSHADAITVDSDEDEHPRAKRARVGSPKAAASAQAPAPISASHAPPKPQWSNPDPYTALPPPGESTNKPKKDVLQLIRQAKIESQAEAKSGQTSNDFISLNFDDDDQDAQDRGEEGEVLSDSDDGKGLAPLNRPKSSFSHLDNLHPQRSLSGSSVTSDAIAKPLPQTSHQALRPLPDMTSNAWPPPPPPTYDARLPPPPPTEDGNQQDYQKAIERQENTALANKPKNKKRKFDQVRDTGDITEVWRAKNADTSTPWHPDGHPIEEWNNADAWLHEEIMDFYDFVKPRVFEGEVRNDLIRRIQHAVDQGMQHVNIEAFGSYASELYLPTADMDLVAMSDAYLRYNNPTIGRNYRQMRRFADCLQNGNLIKYGSLTIIAKAKVPILKFTESVTGLRVDISFENDSGTRALATFARWKEVYPAMPYIVALIKQYLAMRDLSEVVNGGLGGFTIICLVVFTIHNLELSKGVGYARKNLDQALLAFFKHWGTVHNIRTEGLDMRAMRTVPKHYFHGRQSKPDRLLIIDPNNADNNISGGSAGAERIFAKFAKVYHELLQIQEDCESRKHEMNTPGYRSSLLGLLWGGDYESFAIQRRRLDDLHRRGYRLVRPRSPSPASVGDVEIVNPPAQPFVQKAQKPQSRLPLQPAAPQASSHPPVQPIVQHEISSPATQAEKNQKKNEKRKQRKKKKQQQEAEAGRKIGTIGNGKTSSAKQPHPSSVSKTPGPAPTRLKTRSQANSKPQAQQAAPIPNLQTQKEPEKKVEADSKKEKNVLASEKTRAKQFKKTHPGVEAPNRMSKQEFKKFKQIHGNGT